MRLQIPILALSPKGSVVEKIINETRTGINTQYDNVEEMKNFIFKHYNWWKNGEAYKDYNKEEIKKYERKALTGKLAQVFEEVVNVIK